MSRSAVDYIERAVVFRRWARETGNPEHQQLLLRHADTCETLARRIEGPVPTFELVPSSHWSRKD
jgi:hypothetical protein